MADIDDDMDCELVAPIARWVCSNPNCGISFDGADETAVCPDCGAEAAS